VRLVDGASPVDPSKRRTGIVNAYDQSKKRRLGKFFYIRGTVIVGIKILRACSTPPSRLYKVLPIKVLAFLRSMVRPRPRSKAGKIALMLSRLRICRTCPIRGVEDYTCGRIGEWIDLENSRGCWCFLPIASGDCGKRCWLTVHNKPGGWPNPVPAARPYCE
jgi:hypothetical protein